MKGCVVLSLRGNAAAVFKFTEKALKSEISSHVRPFLPEHRWACIPLSG